MTISKGDNVKTSVEIIASFIDEIWNQIGGDVFDALNQAGEPAEMSAEDVVQVCLDANRMETMLYCADDREAAVQAMNDWRESGDSFNDLCTKVAAELPFKKYVS